MQADPAPIMELLPALASLVGAGSFWQGQKLFDGAAKAGRLVDDRLDALCDRQVDALERIIDDEVTRANDADPGNPRELRAADGLRSRAIRRFQDDVWEDALRAQRFRESWRLWQSWERHGTNACTAGMFMSAGLLIVTLGLAATTSPRLSTMLLVFAGVMLLPLAAAAVCFIGAYRHKVAVMRVIEAPAFGAPQHRRFGDA